MRTRKDARLPALVTTAAAIACIGALLTFDPSTQRRPNLPAAPPETRVESDSQAQASEIDLWFQRGVQMLSAGDYTHAAVALRQVLVLAPGLPEAHVNLGFAELALGRHDSAVRHFTDAIDLRPGQANAYYGLAAALELGCDIAGAIGAMRTFIHLAAPDDPFIRKAEAALWEWRAGSGAASPGCPRAAAG